MKSQIGYLIKSINDKVKVHADADLKSHHLTLSQSRVLIYLLQRGGQATQKEIECFLSVSHPTVVGLVSRMEKNGFVTYWPDPQDRRNKIVRLTPHACETGRNMDAVVENMEQRMLAPLSPEQIEQLTQMLELIHQNLE